MCKKSKSIKILHININYVWSALHANLLDELDAQGIKNDLVCPIYEGIPAKYKARENVYFPKCFKKNDRLFFFYKQHKIIHGIEKVVDINEYDCIHAYTLFTDGNAAFKLSKKYGIPYVVAIRATDIKFMQYRPYLRNIGMQILANASKVFFLANSTRQFFVKKYVPEKLKQSILEKSEIVPNGIDAFWINNAFVDRDLSKTISNIDNKNINVICVAQLIKWKRIPVLMQALDLLRAKGWKIKLTVVGKVVDQSELEIVLKDSNTEYVEPVPKEMLIEYYRKADVFALVSERETFGLVYAEAMSQGLPLLYSKGQGFDGQFEEGVIGYHADIYDIEDVANKLESVIDNYKKLASRTTKLIGKFNWKDISAKYYDIYNQVIR